MKFLLSITFLVSLLLLKSGSVFSQDTFKADSVQRSLKASQITSVIKVDGKLDEGEWSIGSPGRNFIQIEPHQGKKVNFDTDVRVLYDKDNLYIGAFCYDTLGKKSIRVPDFMRDFEKESYDYFGLVIDAFHDKRNAVVFITNPYGVQRDLLSFDDIYYDVDWDCVWKVRTQRTDLGWTAEIAIPWKSLRYPNVEDIQSWGINFFRNRRYSNEVSAWSSYPRSTNATRMNYEGVLENIKPPKPGLNINFQPYVLTTYDKYKGADFGNRSNGWRIKIGGEVKWAINSNSVLDLTSNTDFAQANVDRQVNNVSRFDVFFPERRQFFLENASLFAPGLTPQNYLGAQMRIQPFFSRQIGLAPSADGTSEPIPIDAGARFVYRSSTINYGAMYIRQASASGSPATDYLIGRFSKNIGEQNRMGLLFTVKNSGSLPTLPGHTNYVAATDGFFRLNRNLSFDYMAIGSASSDGNGKGVAGYAQVKYITNQWFAYWSESLVSSNYNAEVGFVSRQNVIATTPGVFWVYRGKRLPGFVRSFEPGTYIELYNKASTGNLQEARINFNPLWFTYQTGGYLAFFVTHYFQRLDATDYRPLGLNILSGSYNYTRYSVQTGNDPSKKIQYSVTGETGGYYGGTLNYLSFNFKTSPVPHFSSGFNYEVNQLKHVGTGRVSETLKLYTVDTRIAINPRVQLSAYYQKNTANNVNAWNIRFSWEFKPLSNIYFIYNHGSYLTNVVNKEDHLIFKVSYLGHL